MKESAKEIGLNSNEQLVTNFHNKIELVNGELGKHCLNVGRFGNQIASAADAPYEIRQVIAQIGKIHDLGKIDDPIKALLGIPFNSDITPEQYEVFKTHTWRGAEMARKGGLAESWAYVIETHHEDYDGGGYLGLKGKEIPLAAQVIRIADTYDAILSRTDHSIEWARQEIVSGMGKRYNPLFRGPFEYFVRLQKLANIDNPQKMPL